MAVVKDRLLAGGVQEVLAEWATMTPRDAATWAAEQTYVRNQADRMAYDQYRAAGYLLGSGAVESANRHAVGVRVKQAGMRWTPWGLRGVLALRALLRSARWDGWWDRQLVPTPSPPNKSFVHPVADAGLSPGRHPERQSVAGARIGRLAWLTFQRVAEALGWRELGGQVTATLTATGADDDQNGRTWMDDFRVRTHPTDCRGWPA